MSQLKTTSLSHKDNNGTPNITLFPDGTTSLPGMAMGGFRNLLINGDFRIWQRGTDNTSGSTPGYAGADRWWREKNTRALKQPEGSLEGVNAVLKLEPQSTDKVDLRQAIEIEGPKNFPVGSTWTLSFYIKAQTAGSDISFKLFGADGITGASNLVLMSGANTVIGSTTTDYQKVTHTFTIGTEAGSTNLAAVVHLMVDTTNWVQFSMIQLEPGPVATPYEHRPIQVELALCQRYFFSISGATNVYARQMLVCSGPNTSLYNYFLPVPMREPPAMSLVNITAAVIEIYNYRTANARTFTSFSLNEGTNHNLQMGCSFGGDNNNVGDAMSWRFVGSPDASIQYSAEL